MPLAFLTPLFLAGLALIAVPLWVHLRNRERKGAIEFPSLMFLRRIPYHSVRRQKIRNWPLFLLRAFAVALLAAAFARPFFDRAPASVSTTASSRELVVLLDRSYSMGHGDRWRRAVRAATEAVSTLRSGDRGSVVLFDATAEAATQPTEDLAALRAAITTARVGSGATRFAPALRTARGILADSDRPRRDVLVVSDFQRGGWEPGADASLPPGTTLTFANVAEGRAENVAVTGITTRRAAAMNGLQRVAVSARVTRTGGTGTPRTVPITLDINDRAIQTRDVTLDSSGAATVAFDPAPLPDATSRAVVRAATDALPADDAFHATLAAGRSLRALVLEAPGAPAARSLFLRQALAVGEGAAFDVLVKSASQLTSADLQGRALVILHDAPPPAGEAGRRLAAWVRDGGGLVVALGERSSPREWSGDARTLLPATPGAIVDRLRDRGATLGFVDYAHPALSVFATPRSGDLTSTRFFRYRALTPGDSAEVLARFDDGAVALAERAVGRGRVLVWASSFDNVWNDMPVQPVWVPFLHQLSRHAGAWAEPRQWLTVGQVLDPSRDFAAGAADGANWVARAPAGGSEVIASGGRRTLALSQHGFYVLRREGEPAGAGRPVAVNLDPREGDLAPMDPEEIRLAATPAPGDGASESASLTGSTPAERERRQAVWWYLLVTALVLLALEAAVSNWRAMRRA